MEVTDLEVLEVEGGVGGMEEELDFVEEGGMRCFGGGLGRPLEAAATRVRMN